MIYMQVNMIVTDLQPVSIVEAKALKSLSMLSHNYASASAKYVS